VTTTSHQPDRDDSRKGEPNTNMSIGTILPNVQGVVRSQPDTTLMIAPFSKWGDRSHSLVGPIDVTALDTALSGLVERHQALRSVVDPADGTRRLRVLPRVEPVLRMVDLPEGARRRGRRCGRRGRRCG
jgi:hypothetical protein